MPVVWALLAGCTQGALQVEAWYSSVDVTEFTQEEEEDPPSDYYDVGMVSWEPRGSIDIEIAGGGKVTKKDKALLFGGVRLRKYNGVLELEHKETTSTHNATDPVPLVTEDLPDDLIEQTDVEIFFRAVGWAEGIQGTGTMGLKFTDAPAYNFGDNTASMESGFLLTFGGALDAVIPFGETGVSLRLGVEGSGEVPIAYGGGYSVKLGYSEQKTLIQIGYRHRTWNYIFCPDSGIYPKDYRFSTESNGVFISTMLQF